MLLIVAKARANLLKHREVLGRLRARVDHLTETSYLEPLELVLGKQLSLRGISLFEPFADSHGFCQRNRFLSDVFVLNDQGRHHLDTHIRD